MDPLNNPTVVAGYRIDGTLGEGGMGTVYRATQLSLQRVVALKVLTVELSSDTAFRERFRREGLLQAALEHPHIVTVFEAGQADNRLFLAMQMIEGPTLKTLILKRALGDRRALRLLTQVADALDAAHAKGLIHRDVKPQNVLVGAGDHAYLADFGLTSATGDAPMTETGLFVGTIDYISPEQARGERATTRSDVYALTALLYECLTGTVPFVRGSEERVLLAHLSEDPPRVSDLRDDLPPALDEVIAQGMAKDPADRPASASELVLKARRSLGTLPSTGSDGGATRIATVPAPTPAPAAAGEGSDAITSGGQPVVAASPALGSVAPSATNGRGFLIALLAAVAVAAAGGALLGGMNTRSRSGFSDSASAGNIELSFPSSWRRVPAARAIAGLPLTNALALAPRRAASDQPLLAGELTPSGPKLLPASLLDRLVVPTEPSSVSLGHIAAYRYVNLSGRELSVPLTIYAAPTTAGIVAIACASKTSSIAHECDQVASTLRLSAASAFPLGPSQTYADALSQTFASLQRSITGAATRLAGARNAAAQSTSAAELARAFATAGTSVGRVPASPAIALTNARLAQALTSVANAYSALASAAANEDGAAYARADRARKGALARIASALAELERTGYSVTG